MMISGSKVQKVVRACTIRFLNLGPAKHEKAAIYLLQALHGAWVLRTAAAVFPLPGIQFPHLLCQKRAQDVGGPAQACLLYTSRCV